VKVKRYMRDASTLEAGCRTMRPPAAKRLRPVLGTLQGTAHREGQIQRWAMDEVASG
jgi:hypothetical protein